MDPQVELRQEFMKDLWRWKVGLPSPRSPTGVPPLDQIRRVQISEEFDLLLVKDDYSEEFRGERLARLVMGYFRYGQNRRTSLAATNYTRDILRRIKLHRKTLALEPLVDAVNVCMLEFIGARYRGAEIQLPQCLCRDHEWERVKHNPLRDTYLGFGFSTSPESDQVWEAVSRGIWEFDRTDNTAPLILSSNLISHVYSLLRARGLKTEAVDDGKTINYDEEES